MCNVGISKHYLQLLLCKCYLQALDYPLQVFVQKWTDGVYTNVAKNYNHVHKYCTLQLIYLLCALNSGILSK